MFCIGRENSGRLVPGPERRENETHESRFVSRAEQRETVSSVAVQRTDEDGIIIDWREWPRWRDIEFLRAPLQRYFFLRLNLSFAVPCRESALERKARRGKRKREKVGIARQSRDRESDETHLPKMRTIMPLLPILSPVPRNPSCSLSLQPLSTPSVLFFCKPRLSEEPREVILYTSSFSTRRRSRFLLRVALTYLSGSSFPPL